MRENLRDDGRRGHVTRPEGGGRGRAGADIQCRLVRLNQRVHAGASWGRDWHSQAVGFGFA
jgi:hypothetical protein